MRARRFGLVLLLLSPAGATRADDAEPAPEPVLTDTVVWPDRTIDASAFAALDAGNRVGAGIAVGGEVQVGTGSCGVLSTSGQIAARIGASTVSAAHSLHACIATARLIDPTTDIDITLIPIRIDHDLAWNAMPRLSARRVVWNRPFTSERLEVGFALMSLEKPVITTGWTLVGMPITLRGEWWHQPLDGGEVLRTARFEDSVSLIEARETDGDGHFILFHVGFAGDMKRIDLVWMDKIPIKQTPLRFDAAFGSADVLRYTDELVLSGGFTGRFGLWLDLGRIRAGVGAERAYYATIDEAIVGETRSEARVSYQDDDSARAVTVSAFHATSSLIWTDGSGEIPYQPVYGIGLDAAWPLYRGVEGRLSAGWARSFYAGGGEMLPAPAEGVEVNAQMLVRYDP